MRDHCNREKILEGVDRRAARAVEFRSFTSSDEETVDLDALIKVKVCLSNVSWN